MHPSPASDIPACPLCKSRGAGFLISEPRASTWAPCVFDGKAGSVPMVGVELTIPCGNTAMKMTEIYQYPCGSQILVLDSLLEQAEEDIIGTPSAPTDDPLPWIDIYLYMSRKCLRTKNGDVPGNRGFRRRAQTMATIFDIFAAITERSPTQHLTCQHFYPALVRASHSVKPTRWYGSVCCCLIPGGLVAFNPPHPDVVRYALEC